MALGPYQAMKIGGTIVGAVVGARSFKASVRVSPMHKLTGVRPGSPDCRRSFRDEHA